MKTNRLRIGFISTVFLVVIFAAVGRTELIVQDLYAPGDGLLTHDSDTGLYWLDLTVTNGISYTDMLPKLQPDGEYSGFRYATQDEIAQLWTNGGVVYMMTFPFFLSENLEPVAHLQSLLGITLISPPSVFTAGFTEPSGGSASQIGMLQVLTIFPFSVAAAYFSDTLPSSTDYGHWLVLLPTTEEAIEPEEAIDILIKTIEDMSLAPGIADSLKAKLEAAQDAISAANAERRGDAINKLQAAINAVEAQRGKKLTDAQADTITDAVNDIIASLSGMSAAPGRPDTLNPIGKSTTAWGGIKNKQ